MKANRPFVFINMAITADGKIATANREVASFGSGRDRRQLLALRAQADAILVGARTVDLNPITLGPGPARYRRLRLRRGLSEFPLRVVVTGTGTVHPDAEVFRHRFSPVLILTSASATPRRLARLRRLATAVHVSEGDTIDFHAAFGWLACQWAVKRLLVEGGGELNDALFRCGLVDRLHLTVCPWVFGGATAPTLADGHGFDRLAQAAPLRLTSWKRQAGEAFFVFDVQPAPNRRDLCKLQRPIP
jgi:riboflavin-specific deaminase-like protein